MSKACMINLKVWKDRDVIVAIQHGINLCLFQVWSQFNCSCSIDVNKHKLVNKIFTKVGKVSNRWHNFGEVSNSYWVLNAQTIRFKEYSFLLQPIEEMAFGALKLDVAEAAVAKNMAVDAYLRFILSFNMGRRHFEILFELRFSSR